MITAGVHWDLVKFFKTYVKLITLYKSFTFYAILLFLYIVFFYHIHYVHTSTKYHQKTHSFSFTNTMRAQSHNPTLEKISVAEKLIKHIVTFKKDLDSAIRDGYFFNTTLQSR